MILWKKIRISSLGSQKLLTIRNKSSSSEINLEKLERESVISDNTRELTHYCFLLFLTNYVFASH